LDRHTARAAGLRYVADSSPGLERRKLNGSFSYYYPDGRPVRSRAVVRRVNALAIPPAYTDVWICADPHGHIQATGRDARGRKQYRYHARWRAVRDATKFERMAAFGAALPRIRRQVAADLTLPGVPRDKVLATVVRLLETTLIRVGNEEYARTNGSYGLTTLCTRHVDVSGSEVRFAFRGKSGIVQRVKVNEPRLARVVRRCLDIPGQDLFQYLDEAGEPRPVRSTDVNAYLQQASGADFSAKDYRTWAASVLALSELMRCPFESATEARGHVVATMKTVAARLGNTPAICRKSYVHPGLVEAYTAGSLAMRAGHSRGLNRDEAAFMAFLRRPRGRRGSLSATLRASLARAKRPAADAAAANL
jgi:DNA topoisomerase-1